MLAQYLYAHVQTCLYAQSSVGIFTQAHMSSNVGVCSCASVCVCDAGTCQFISAARMRLPYPPSVPAFDAYARSWWANAGSGKQSLLLVKTCVLQTPVSGTA